ncbi:hypothetical protein BGZ49_006462, partial [Haplosporangium sp. Z 27]
SRRRQQPSTPVVSVSTSTPSIDPSDFVTINSGNNVGARVRSFTEGMTMDNIPNQDTRSHSLPMDTTTTLHPLSMPIPMPTSTTVTTTVHPRSRSPSPYPYSPTSPQVHAHSRSTEFQPNSSFRHTTGDRVSLRSHLDEISHLPRAPSPASSTALPAASLPIPTPQTYAAPQQPQRRKVRWVQKAIAKVVKFQKASENVVSKKAYSIAKIFTRRRSSKEKHHHQDNNQQPTSPNSSILGSSVDDEDIEDLDLRYFYDPCSEDPVNRMVFIAGPEHFYHLALQLETSPLQEYQLYAKELFIRSAGLGYAPAQFKLGICYELGLTHFPTEPAQSFAWYKQAALQGHADAELAVSGWYLTGHPQGLVQSEPLAYHWASKAARKGWSKAEYTLGHYHEVGIGVAQDLGVAKQWYIKAASKGNERALLRLLVGDVGLDVDYAQLKDALLNQNQHNPYLIHQLAQFHELREYGLVPDEDAAFELYAASAQANYAPAQYKLGACYEFGILGCPRDPVQAVHWYSQGAGNGHVEALLALAGYYLDGSAGPAAEQSDEDAFRYVKTAAKRGVPKAEYITGFFLEHGLGVEKNTKEAKKWYRLACAKGVDTAEHRLRVLEMGEAPVAATA